MGKVGVIGCGLMGSGIAKNLLKNNYEVMVYDINEDAVKNLVNQGAVVASKPEELASQVDYLILSLTSPELVKEIVIDEDRGVLYRMNQGKFILDMSTNDVNLTRQIHEMAQTRGVEFYDCPLSGGPDGANNGTLTIMIGGNEERFDEILPVLQVIGKHIEYLGESGAGQTVKLCHNMVVAGVISLLSEAFLTGEKAGVSKEKLASILQKGSGHTRAMDVFGVNILDQSFENVKFSLANMTKDIHLYRNLAEDHQTTTFVSDMTNQLFSLGRNKGKGNLDSSAVYEVLVEMMQK
ncbi:NAD(P)-dependent oxidoreductase [Ureibacillus chungkukjangi]|uniref:3-hydroxyisobutyrate dehydrogenase/2-hydroxy-3-oxopropionate reductase n=1 Tax=Ureibacillus chungkukjangi TaxID=1202712 RepID=A0A318TP28_9BACL|nr:NAD(P)-dependent oxidoreductase [Ureibacillus chungkukjangi]PYF05620.1 3-hydroxyisobutyrate dehydrogenase/2-hydroxy-3-oxopropionate reductase [Ureibacillus chungkukjangi]